MTNQEDMAPSGLDLRLINIQAMKFSKCLTLWWLVSSSFLCPLQGGEISCGKKMWATDLKELRGLADYVGTQGIMMGKDSSKHEVFRHYRHKALLMDIVWIEDIKGVIKKMAIYHKSKDVETYENIVFGEGITIVFSTDSIHIRKVLPENSQN